MMHILFLKTYPFVASRYGIDIAPIPAGYSSIAFANYGGHMGYLKSSCFPRLRFPAERLKRFIEKRFYEIRLKLAGLRFFHFFFDGKKPLFIHNLFTKGIAS